MLNIFYNLYQINVILGAAKIHHVLDILYKLLFCY